MSIRENKYRVLDHIKPNNILISVFDKTGLAELVEGIVAVCPSARFYSTGGTGAKISETLGARAAEHYLSVEEFTGAPEMEGGLVKTLHPKIHAGLLAERGNPAHEEYLFRTLAEGGTPGVYFDLFVGNLYPFSEVVSRTDATAETARINIDIGGPAMTMASAKNWHSVAVLSDPAQYREFLSALTAQGGSTTLAQRFGLAKQAMKRVGEYRSAIGEYFSSLDFGKDVQPHLTV